MATSMVMPTGLLDLDALEEGFLVRRIRDRLLRPTLEERVAQARARYGRVYTLGQLRAAAYPRRRGRLSRFERGSMEPLEIYRALIPDDALLRYNDASETESFSQFWVVTPTRVGRDRPARWLVGQLRGGVQLYAIVARWHIQAGRGNRRRPSPTVVSTARRRPPHRD